MALADMLAVSATAKTLDVILLLFVFLVLAFRVRLARFLIWVVLGLLTSPFRAMSHRASSEGSKDQP